MGKVPLKTRLKKQADRLWFEVCLKRNPRCLLCGGKAKQVHHFFPKGQYSPLRYSLDNGISLCMGCHFKLHHSDASLTAEIRHIMGGVWYNRLKKQAELKGTLNTSQWYKRNMENLRLLNEHSS